MLHRKMHIDVVAQDCPPFPGLPAYVRLVAGATLTGQLLKNSLSDMLTRISATNALVKEGADIAICWDGGR